MPIKNFSSVTSTSSLKPTCTVIVFKVSTTLAGTLIQVASGNGSGMRESGKLIEDSVIISFGAMALAGVGFMDSEMQGCLGKA
jgi:hypothetical protein